MGRGEKRIHKVPPSFVSLAPDCGPFSALQNIAVRSRSVSALERRRRRLRLARKQEAAAPGWEMTVRVWHRRRRQGLLTVVENPKHSRAWRKYFADVPEEHYVDVHQCVFGQKVAIGGTAGRRVKKPTRFLVSDLVMARRLRAHPGGLVCRCKEPHDPVMQVAGASGPRRSQQVSSYPAALCRWMLKAA